MSSPFCINAKNLPPQNLSEGLLIPEGNNTLGWLQTYGYVDQVTVFGAPYDWRYAPDNQQGYFDSLQALVEHAYRINNKQRVTLYGEGSAAMMTLAFFNYMDEKIGTIWATTYICNFYSVGGLYAGAISTIYTLTQAIDLELDFPPIDKNDPYFNALWKMEGSWPVHYWNFPRLGPGVDTYGKLVPVVGNDTRIWSTPELGDFIMLVFNDSSYVDTWLRVRNITSQPFNAPPVNTTLIHSTDDTAPVSSSNHRLYLS